MHKAKHSVVELFKKAKEINIDIDSLYSLSIEFNQSDSVDEVEYYLHSLEVLNTIALKKNIHVHCVLDEFQDILKLSNKEILNKSRSVMQHHKNITYIFLGSIESIMSDIFENKSSPFFHFTKIIPLPPLNIKELQKYVKSVFDDKKIESKSITKFLKFLNGHPDYSMQYLQKVYITSLAYNISYLSDEKLHDFLIEVIYENKAYIDELINKAKAKKHHLEVLFSLSQGKKANIDGKSLYNINASLEDMGLIRNVRQGKYEIVDIFLQTVLSIGGFEMLQSDIEISQLFLKFQGEDGNG